MPKKSLNSVKIKSVNKKILIDRLKEWSYEAAKTHKEILKIGYFGSYARDDYTPSSDLDILIVVKHSNKPPHKRLLDYSLDYFPVGCEVFVFTEEEIRKKKESKKGWLNTILSEIQWILS